MAKNSKQSKASQTAEPTQIDENKLTDKQRERLALERSGQNEDVDDSNYEDKSNDLDGFIDPFAAKVHVRLIEARAMDSDLDERKVSVLLIGELCSRRTMVKDGEAVQGEIGDRVGIWYKPGMRDALNHAGVPMTIAFDREIDTGKPNPMKKFTVKTDKDGTPLPLQADYRKKSKEAELPLPAWNESAAPAPALNGAKGAAPDDADIPF